MRRFSFLVILLVALFWLNSSQIQSQCDPFDLGYCDTLHLVPLDATDCEDFPCLVRVLVLVSHDSNTYWDPARQEWWQDSLFGFTVPLCYTHTNPSKYCSLSSWLNQDLVLWVVPDFSTRSVWRHIVNESDPAETTYHNRMADIAADFGGREWDARNFYYASDSSWHYWEQNTESLFVAPHFWMSLAPSGLPDQSMWEGYRFLLNTITFKVEDTMTICMDSCFWPPGTILRFGRPDAKLYTPIFHSICFKVDSVPASVKEIQGSEESRPLEFSLSQNYPNPFNPATSFRFSLSKSSHVKIEIFNIVGQRLKTLVDQEMNAGVYVVDWDGKDVKSDFVASGIYFYRMQAGDFSDMKKMVLLK